MGDNGDGEFLDLLGSDKFPPIKQSEGLGSLHQREGSAGASPELHAGDGASAGDDLHHVAFDFFADAYLADGALEVQHIRKGDTTGDSLERMALLLGSEDRDFFLCCDVTETEIHGESIHLSLRQRIGASKLDRILGGNDEEEFRQSAPFPFDADLRFPHCLEEGGLSPRRGAINFIREKNVGEDGALVKLKLLLFLIV